MSKYDERGFLSAVKFIDGDERNGCLFRIYLPDPKTGKLKQITRQSRHWNYWDAEKEYLMMEQMGSRWFERMNNIDKPKPKRNDDSGKEMLLLDEVFKRFLETKEGEQRASYLDIMRINYEAHIQDHFKYFYMSAITQDLVDKWKIMLNRKHVKNSTYKLLSTHTKNQIITILRKLFAFAYDKGYLTTPLKVDRIKESRIRFDSATRPYWPDDEWGDFLDVIPEENLSHKALFSLLFATAARISEIRGLHESSFNFRDNSVTINKNLIRRKKKDGQTAYIEGDTKGSDVRIISLEEDEIQVVKELIELRKAEEGKDYNRKTTFLFSQNGKDPISPTSAARMFNAYKALAIKNNPNMNPDVTLHGLRHSVGTFVANEDGVPDAQKLLGHASLETTSVYVHKSNKNETAKKISSRLKKNKGQISDF
jgi:integrase